MAINATPISRKHDRRTEVVELRLELWARSEEERTYVHRARDGFVRILRCLEGGLVTEAHQLAAAGAATATRRIRQLDGGTDDAA